jgi:hypothetical protein
MNARHSKFLELSNLHGVKTLILCAHWSFNIPKSSILDGGGFLQSHGMSKLDANSECVLLSLLSFLSTFSSIFFKSNGSQILQKVVG